MSLPGERASTMVRLSVSPVEVPALKTMARCEVTLLFSDLLGYSAFTEESDVTEVAAVMSCIKQESAKIVRDHGGLINQFVGDEIVAIFGFPEKHEDDTRRAASAAIDLHAFVRSSRVAKMVSTERWLALHSGIDVGMLLIDTRDVRDGLFGLTGSAMNRAARLKSAAEPDEILASDRAHRALSRFFITEQLAPRQFKGISETIVPYRVIARRERTSLGAVGSRLSTRAELSVLCEHWNQATEHGGRIVELLGAPGSGKSRLLNAFIDRFHTDPARAFTVDCRAADSAPFSTIKRMLDDHLMRLTLLSVEQRTQRAAQLREAAGPFASHIAALSPRLAEVLSDVQAHLDAVGTHQVFVTSLVEFLAKYLEAVGPSVLAIDDAHRLDAGSRVVLSALSSRLHAGGHLLVYTARDSLEQHAALGQLRATLPSERLWSIVLGPLNLQELSELVAEYLGLDDVADGELVRQLAVLSDGSPLAALELLRLTIERGHLTQRADSWELDPSLHTMKLPRSSEELIQRRIDLLSPESSWMLRRAATLGSPIQLETLSWATGAPRASVERAMREAQAAGLLLINSDGLHAFVHDCVWDTLLRALPDSERRDLHTELASALVAHGDQGVAFNYLVARQYASSHLPHEPARAFGALTRAARQALEAYDDVLALSFLRPANEAAGLAGIRPERAFYVDLAESSLRAGDIHGSLSYFEVALERSEAGFERAHVFGRIAWIHHFESNVAGCWNALTAALAQFGRSAPGAELAAGGVRRMFTSSVSGRSPRELSQPELETLAGLYEACIRVAGENGQVARVAASALRLARVVMHLRACRARVHAELTLGFVQTLFGMSAAGRLTCAHAERLAAKLRDPIAQTSCHRVRHVVSGWQGDLSEAERQAVLCHESRHWMELTELCHICVAMYGIETVRGRPEQAWVWIQRALDRVRYDGRSPAILSVIEQAACATLWTLDRGAEAQALQRRLAAVERAQLQPGSYFHLLCFQSRVQQCVARENLDADFEALVDEFDQLTGSQHVHQLAGVHYLHVAHARIHQCLQVDASARGRGPWLAKLERLSRIVQARMGQSSESAHTLFLQAACAWLRGSKKADSLLSESERIAEVRGFPWVSCAALRLRTHMLREAGNPEAARAQAKIAALLAHHHGQYPMLRAIRREFALADGLEWQTLRVGTGAGTAETSG